MNNQLLYFNLDLSDFKFGILSFVTAFVIAMIVMPPLIKFINYFKLFDVPDARKEHCQPIPTMGGIASCVGFAFALLIWFPFEHDSFTISFFLSIAVLLCVGIFDDLKNLPARYKLIMQVAVATMIAVSGVRITSFNGLFGIYELHITAQYSFTILAIAGITNAYNLIDGIDGLAGGLGFMSLIVLGLFLTLSGDSNNGLIAFALCGGLLGFLYYNFNPAKIFMGDTGSLVLGFVIAVLSIRLIQINPVQGNILTHAPVFVMSVVIIPVFDTVRVFMIRIWQGKSPFSPDKNHIHHLLTNNGWSHSFTAKVIYFVHAFMLLLGYFLKSYSLITGMSIMVSVMLFTIFIFQRLRLPQKAVILEPTSV
jgi:UDP-N-acetylmuramyl pentapeptide phosphotransferase/UDP-N-acetylglucosamine-1-phosphate transferase